VLLETAVAVFVLEGEPAFRCTDFLAETEVGAAGPEGVRFILLSKFRVIVYLLFSAAISFISLKGLFSLLPGPLLMSWYLLQI
jgi:hypothetical protein